MKHFSSKDTRAVRPEGTDLRNSGHNQISGGVAEAGGVFVGFG